MLGVGGAGGLGLFFLPVARLDVAPASPRCGFFFLAFRDSELLLPAGSQAVSTLQGVGGGGVWQP